MNPVAAEEPFEPVELVDVLPAGTVGVVLMAVAEICGIGHQALGLAVQAGWLKLQRPLERLGLVAARQFVRVRGVRPLDGVTYQDEELHAGQVTRDALRGQRVEHVVGARLESHRGSVGRSPDPARVRA